jgi:proteasome activator subunit 4
VWGKTVGLYSLPPSGKSAFLPWEPDSAQAIEGVREIALDAEWWKKVIVFYSEENHENSIIQDDVSCVKSICEFLYSMRQTTPS